eukprot:4201004-Pleurochrysis_carterae.AAC.1
MRISTRNGFSLGDGACASTPRPRHLSGDGEVGGAAEKVVGKRVLLRHLSLAAGLGLAVVLGVGVVGSGVIGQRGHAEELAGALAVGGGDEGCVHHLEALGCEKGMRRVRERRSHACDGTNRVGARAQVRDRAEELERVPLLLQRVAVRRAVTNQPQAAHAHLDRLPLGRRLNNLAKNRDSCARRQVVHHAIGLCLAWYHQLHALET